MKELKGVWADGRHWNISVGSITSTLLPVAAVAAVVFVNEGIELVHSTKRGAWEFPIGKVENYQDAHSIKDIMKTEGILDF